MVSRQAINSAPQSEKFDDLIARATIQDLLRQEVLLTIAVRALNSRLYGIGRKYATEAIDATDTPWPVTKMTLAQCISHDVLLGSGAKPVEGFSETDKKLLKEADDIFKEAVSDAKDRDEGYIAAHALIERAGIAERLGDEKAARPFVEEAYRLAPDDSNAQSAYATLLQRLGDTDRAIAIVEQTPLDAVGGGGFKRQLAELLLSRARGDDEQRAANLLNEISIGSDPLTAEPTPIPTPASKLIQGRPTEAGDNNTISTGEAFRASTIVVNHISPPPMLS